MTKVSTRPQVGATAGQPPQPPRIGIAARLPAPHPAIEFDSTAIDVITLKTDHMIGLASCAACLAAVEAAGQTFAGHELVADGLPSLNFVIMDMVRDVREAGDQLWNQYQEARAIANGEVQS